MFLAAFISLLCTTSHTGQVHSLILKSFTSSFLYPQQLHIWLLAKNNYKELIQNIIEESYTDSQFTLSVLSEKLDLSSGYLSIMFKKKCL